MDTNPGGQSFEAFSLSLHTKRIGKKTNNKACSLNVMVKIADENAGTILYISKQKPFRNSTMITRGLRRKLFHAENVRKENDLFTSLRETHVRA